MSDSVLRGPWEDPSHAHFRLHCTTVISSPIKQHRKTVRLSPSAPLHSRQAVGLARRACNLSSAHNPGSCGVSPQRTSPYKLSPVFRCPGSPYLSVSLMHVAQLPYNKRLAVSFPSANACPKYAMKGPSNPW